MNAASRPWQVVTPGEILREELEARGWTQVELAEILGKPVQSVNEILGGKKAITPETALGLAEALGTSAELWVNLQANYELARVRASSVNGPVKERAALRQAAPYREMIRRGWIPGSNRLEEIREQVLAFFGVSSLDQCTAGVAQFKRTAGRSPDEGALAAWVRRVQLRALEMPAAAYHPRGAAELAPTLRILTRQPDSPRVLINTLNSVGVRVVLERHLPRTHIDGAALWLRKDAPVIGLSLRYDRLDCFWFTALHELAHILKHNGTKGAFLDEDLVQDGSDDPAEQEANSFAGSLLLQPHELDQLRPPYSRANIEAFAERILVHPAIVVGRLHHDGLLPHSHLRGLIPTVKERGMLS